MTVSLCLFFSYKRVFIINELVIRKFYCIVFYCIFECIIQYIYRPYASFILIFIDKKCLFFILRMWWILLLTALSSGTVSASNLTTILQNNPSSEPSFIFLLFFIENKRILKDSYSKQCTISLFLKLGGFLKKCLSYKT